MCMKSRQPMEEIWKPKVRTCREGHFCCPHLSLLYTVGMLSHVWFWFFVTPWSVPIRLLCPWDFPGKNTGVGCHFLLHRIFLTQGLNLCLLHQQVDSLPLHHLGSLSPLVFILYETPSTPSTNDIYSECPLSKLWSAGIFTQLDWWSRAPCGHDLDLSILLKPTCCLWSP